MRQRAGFDPTRADAGRLGTMYDEGACMATPALELIDRANRDAANARAVRAAAGARSTLRARLVGLRDRVASTLRR